MSATPADRGLSLADLARDDDVRLPDVGECGALPVVAVDVLHPGRTFLGRQHEVARGSDAHTTAESAALDDGHGASGQDGGAPLDPVSAATVATNAIGDASFNVNLTATAQQGWSVTATATGW